MYYQYIGPALSGISCHSIWLVVGCLYDVNSVLLKAKFLIELPVGPGARAGTRLDKTNRQRNLNELDPPRAETATPPMERGTGQLTTQPDLGSCRVPRLFARPNVVLSFLP
jgi:hypothetical protein